MFDFVDNFLNEITMYRLVLYYLTFLLLVAMVLGQFGLVPYSPFAILYSTAIITAVSWAVNELCARFLKVHTNVESVYITAFILTLIISPPLSGGYVAALPLLVWVSVWGMASKYILNLQNKHIFNPAAIAVVITALFMHQSATWWVGTASLFWFVLIGGLLVIRKVQRFDAVTAFTLASLVAVVAFVFGHGDVVTSLKQIILTSPLVFLAAVMLTEPLTMPPTRDGRIAYGILVGLLFIPQSHVGSFYFTPELALVIGNVFSYAVSPKGRHVLKLQEIRQAGKGVYDFIFTSDRTFNFKPGQYMEWTLSHPKPDIRGNRRYFTLASAPTEKNIILGIKFYNESSSYKKHLLGMKVGESIVASQLAGEFTLPVDAKQKLVFVAGGVGITPFRSMLQYLIDKKEQRIITVLYSNRFAEEIAYQDVLSQAHQVLGVKTVYTVTEKNLVNPNWNGYTGYINANIIAREVPDFNERMFYISGSNTMVKAFKHVLVGMGVERANIKTDFFPGLA